jgi:hypothetical protein
MRTKEWALIWTIARAAMAVVTIAAIIAQLTASTTTALELGRDVVTTWANFFSFFTILSNAVSSIVLLWAAVWYLSRGRSAADEPFALATALACVSSYMIITGVVYNTLLRGIDLPQGSEPIPWSNEVLHLIGPIFLLLDVFLGPLRRRLPWRTLWVIVAFPVLWAVYTMIRGPLVTNPTTGDPYWYPYPFLNPNNPDLWPAPGYGGVAVWIAIISVAFLAVGAFVVWVGRRRGASPDEEQAAQVEETMREHPGAG